jgi:hypothetical protein
MFNVAVAPTSLSRFYYNEHGLIEPEYFMNCCRETPKLGTRLRD